ncbi:aspartyl-phosphate phosphatase Spo0E family protein [Niallia sp. 01092]|uniref:aspartyl-phosphate phosphatase Spo0E family protein n=1 Tax=unclassified Niallia TaxID=2837522 RepID=UPI003FD2D426
MSEKKLLQDIEEHREKLIYLANHTSFSHPRVINISTELDELLNKYNSFLLSKYNKAKN